jgi:hypothetical protein
VRILGMSFVPVRSGAGAAPTCARIPGGRGQLTRRRGRGGARFSAGAVSWLAGLSASGARGAEAGGVVLDRDPAPLGGRGKGLVVGIHRDDVVEAGHRPIGPVFAVRAVVDRILPPQPLEPGRPGVGGEVADVRDVELVERRRRGPLPGRLHQGVVTIGHGGVPTG